MKQLFGAVALVTVLAGPAAAQLNSLPVFVSPKGGTGFTLALDYGRGVNDESGRNTALGARASLGLGPVAFGVGVGTANPAIGALAQRDTELQYMGNASIRLIGSALVPVAVNLHAGVGVLNTGSGLSAVKEINIPIGVGFALNVPTPGFTFEPWVAPRWSIRRVEIGGVNDQQTGFGLSAGIGLGFAMGLGLHVALDWADLSAATLVNPQDIPAIQPAVFGIGLNYTFRLPGLGIPMAPGI